MSLNRTGRKTGRSSWLSKAPRRRDRYAPRQFGRCETLESRQMLSADGLGLEPASLIVGDEVVLDLKGPITPAADSDLLPVEQTFLLASKPDSDYTIYLDFNGHITFDIGWDEALFNSGNPRFGQPFSTPEFSLDGDSSFSDEELNTIQEVFMRVAEDFAPFDVNVTTIEPSIEDLRKIDDDDARYGMRVAIGGSAFDWYLPTGGGLGAAGGVALLGTFQADADRPTYVFREAVFGEPDNIALATSHEVGHTLNLIHDGNLVIPPPFANVGTAAYYPGHDNDSWGSIMGAPYGVGVSQWSAGDYLLSYNALTGDEPPEGVFVIDDPVPPITVFQEDPDTGEVIIDEMTGLPIVETIEQRYLQDDLAQITSNGFGYREDDHSDVAFTAVVVEPNTPTVITPLATQLDLDFENDVASGSGLIETNTDVDFFQFETEGGDITINANPNSFGANLDIKLELYDADGTLIETAAPDYDLTASLTIEDQPAGIYYISITGDGFRADAQEFERLSAGYGDYGSLGRYSLVVNADLGEPLDQFEVNDTFETATEIPLGDFSFDDLSFHVEGDQDYYKWTAAADGQLVVNASFLHSESNVELFVYDENQQDILARSVGIGDFESVTLGVEEGDVLFVLVNSRNNATLETYSLVIDGPGLQPDQFEVNDTPEEATVIAEPSFMADASIHVSGDVDHYLFQAAGNGTLLVEVEHPTLAPDLVIELFDGDVLVATSTPILDELRSGQSVELAVFTGDLLTIRVRVADGTPVGFDTTTYTLKIEGPVLEGDPLEPNGRDNPTLVTTESELFNRISIHTPTDRDHFVYTAPSNGQLGIEAEFLHDFGDLDIRVTNEATGEFIALASTITDNESLTINVRQGVTYLIEAYGYLGDLVPVYGIRTTFTAAVLAPADLNQDGLVNDGDRLFWAAQYGSTGPGLTADLNNDQVVNAADYTVWRDLASTTSTSGGAASFSIDGHEHHEHVYTGPGFPAYVEPTNDVSVAIDNSVTDLGGLFTQHDIEAKRVSRPLTSTPMRASFALDAFFEVPGATELADNDETAYESLIQSAELSEDEQLAELDAAFGASI